MLVQTVNMARYNPKESLLVNVRMELASPNCTLHAERGIFDIDQQKSGGLVGRRMFQARIIDAH
jgi:hypothetical protein